MNYRYISIFFIGNLQFEKYSYLSKIFTFKLNVTFQIVNYSDSKTVEEICEHSTKLITLIDLAGHHKYLKTTIFGLTGYCPDFAMLVVSANTGMGKRLLLHKLYLLHQA